MFDRLRPGDPISVADLRRMADFVQRFSSAIPSGQVGSAYTTGGTAPLPQIQDLFTARITEADGTGLARKYSITEINTKPGDISLGALTRVQDRTSGRVAEYKKQPARSIDPNATYQVDDLVLVRRNVADVNEFEILVLLGRRTSGPSTGGCSGKLGWLLDTASLTLNDPANQSFPRAMAIAVLESKGRCDCIAAPAGDSAAIRFFDAVDNPTTSPYGSDPFAALTAQAGDRKLLAKWDGSQWEGLGSVAACCSGCMSFVFTINAAATLLLSRPVFTVAISGGCKISTDTNPANPPTKTFTMLAECGNDGYVKLVGFDNQACEYEPTTDCTNLFRIGLVCVPCSLPNVGCSACSELIAASVFSVTVGGRKYYLRASGAACACSWASDCGNVTMAVSDASVTLTGPDWSYSGDFSLDPEGTVCRNGWTLTKITGSGSLASTVVVAPQVCRPMTAECCRGSFPEQIRMALVYTGIPGTEELPPYCQSVLPQTILSWSETALDDGMGNYTPGWVGSITLPGSNAEAPTCTYAIKLIPCNGDTVTPPNYPVTLWIDSDDYLFTMTCDLVDFTATPGDLCGCSILADWSWAFRFSPLSDPYWCVQDGESFSCTQSPTEPDGAVSGPSWTAADCVAACACAAGGNEVLLMGMASPMAAAMPLVGNSHSRYLPLPQVPCKYLGELLTPCTSCGGSKPERDVYACEHPANDEGRCTRGDPGKFGAWTCGACEKYTT